MALENLKSVFNEGVGTKEQSDLKSIYNSSPASNTETTSVTGFLGPQNNFIQDFNICYMFGFFSSRGIESTKS